MQSRKLKHKKNFHPCEAFENEEVFSLGVFRFNITRIYEHIQNGTLAAGNEDIDVEMWYSLHSSNKVNETHLSTVDTSQPVIQAEISPGRYVIIDGNHRLEKAHRNQIQSIPSYKIRAEQLLNYFTEEKGYSGYVDYWNAKLKDI